MKKGLDGDTIIMKKGFLFVKKHAAALSACALAGIFALSAFWLRSSGVERAFLAKTEKTETTVFRSGAQEESVFYSPAAGNVIVPFSADTLQYNPTTRVYEIHAGMDFLCPDGNVYCVADGRVEALLSDPLWGNTIIVLHENGDKSLYASLSETLVRKGQNVKTGDVIGKSGTSALIEQETGPHLHFEYRIDGKSSPISFTTGPET